MEGDEKHVKRTKSSVRRAREFKQFDEVNLLDVSDGGDDSDFTLGVREAAAAAAAKAASADAKATKPRRNSAGGGSGGGGGRELKRRLSSGEAATPRLHNHHGTRVPSGAIRDKIRETNSSSSAASDAASSAAAAALPSPSSASPAVASLAASAPAILSAGQPHQRASRPAQRHGAPAPVGQRLAAVEEDEQEAAAAAVSEEEEGCGAEPATVSGGDPNGVAGAEALRSDFEQAKEEWRLEREGLVSGMRSGTCVFLFFSLRRFSSSSPSCLTSFHTPLFFYSLPPPPLHSTSSPLPRLSHLPNCTTTVPPQAVERSTS